MSSRWPIREGRPLKNHTWEHGEASSMCPRRSRRTFESVTSTPHLSQITPRCFMRLYLPHKHSQSATVPKIRAQNRPARAVVNGLGLGHFAVRPAANLFRRGKADADRVEIRDRISEFKWVRAEQ